MLATMKALLRAKDLCVLATSAQDTPHCSLMAYAANETGDEIYMVTLKDSQKYKNLLQNPRVSLLIDTRDNGNPRAENTQALTVAGIFKPMEGDGGKSAVLRCLLDRHPQLDNLVNRRDVEIIRIKIESFLLLDGVVKAYFEKVE